jgi:IS30 family transposase
LGVPRNSKQTIAGGADRKSLYFVGKKISQLKETMFTFKKLLQPYDIFSATMDNGPENANYKILGIPTFFCHPYSAWEKPIIENSFRRLRKYIPKKASLYQYSDEKISDIINRINNIPRKRLGWKTPKEVFFQQQAEQLKQLQIFNLIDITSRNRITILQSPL